MNPMLREVEERYGVARSILLPVVVSPPQLDMLRTSEQESAKGWNILVLLFAGARLVTEAPNGSTGVYRLPEFRLPSDILDLEVFEEEFKEKIADLYKIELDIGRYLMMVHCTFMIGGQDGESNEDAGTSSRTLHIFTARALNSDELTGHETQVSSVRLVKPQALLDALQAEWADTKAQLVSGGKFGDLKTEYDRSFSFVRARLVATAFQNLFGWPLPEL